MANINDLMLRYKTQTAGAIRKFIVRHLHEINIEGVEHAKQTSNGWIFDAEAVKRIDELRGFSQVAIIENAESETIKELQNEIDDLKQILLMTQAKLIKAQEDLNENQKLLLEYERKFLAVESQSKVSKSELQIEKNLHDVTKQKLE